MVSVALGERNVLVVQLHRLLNFVVIPLDDAVVLVDLFGLAVKHKHDIGGWVSQGADAALLNEELGHEGFKLAVGCFHAFLLVLESFDCPVHLEGLLDVDVGYDVSSDHNEVVFEALHVVGFPQSIADTAGIRVDSLHFDLDLLLVLLIFDELQDLLSVLAGDNYDLLDLVDQQELNDIMQDGHICHWQETVGCL